MNQNLFSFFEPESVEQLYSADCVVFVGCDDEPVSRLAVEIQHSKLDLSSVCLVMERAEVFALISGAEFKQTTKQ